MAQSRGGSTSFGAGGLNVSAANMSAMNTSAMHHGETSVAYNDRPTHLEQPIDTASGDDGVMGPAARGAGGGMSFVSFSNERSRGPAPTTPGSRARNRTVQFASPVHNNASFQRPSNSHLHRSAPAPYASGPSVVASTPRRQYHHQGQGGQYSRTPRPNEPKYRSFYASPRHSHRMETSRTSVSIAPDTRRVPTVVHAPNRDHSILDGTLSRSDINMTRYENRIPQDRPGDVLWRQPPNHMPAPIAVASTADKVGKV